MASLTSSSIASHFNIFILPETQLSKTLKKMRMKRATKKNLLMADVAIKRFIISYKNFKSIFCLDIFFVEYRGEIFLESAGGC